MERKCKIISAANQKGGVGKTTTITSLARLLAKKGHKTLLFDADPNAHATSMMTENIDYKYTSYDLIKGRNFINCIVNTKYENLDCVPSCAELGKLENNISLKTLDKRLKRITRKNYYDYILIDTPSTVGTIIANSLYVSNVVIIPIQADYLSLQGLNKLLANIRKIEKKTKQSMHYFLLITMVKEDKGIEQKIIKWAEEKLRDILITTYVGHDMKFLEASSSGTSIIDLFPDAVGTRDYMKVLEDLFIKLKNERIL